MIKTRIGAPNKLKLTGKSNYFRLLSSFVFDSAIQSIRRYSINNKLYIATSGAGRVFEWDFKGTPTVSLDVAGSMTNKLLEFNGWMFVITEQGIRYFNGATWTLTLGIPSLAHSIGIYNGDLYTGYFGDLYKYDIPTNTWILFHSTTLAQITGIADDGTNMFICGMEAPYSRIYKFDGATWTLSNEDFFPSIYQLYVDGTRIYALFFGRIKYSDDNGNNWNNLGGTSRYCSQCINHNGTMYFNNLATNEFGTLFIGTSLVKDYMPHWRYVTLFINCLETINDLLYLGNAKGELWIKRPTQGLQLRNI
jgi:hypothetical protein